MSVLTKEQIEMVRRVGMTDILPTKDWLDTIAALESRIAVLEDALLRLTNEASAMLIVEHEMREAAGNANVNVFRMRIDEARDALAKPAASLPRKGLTEIASDKTEQQLTQEFMDELEQEERPAAPASKPDLEGLREAIAKAWYERQFDLAWEEVCGVERELNLECADAILDVLRRRGLLP